MKENETSLPQGEITMCVSETETEMKGVSGMSKVIRNVPLVVSGSCCLLALTAGGSWETWSSPTDMQSSCDRGPNTAPSAPFCSACRASRRGGMLRQAGLQFKVTPAKTMNSIEL